MTKYITKSLSETLKLGKKLASTFATSFAALPAGRQEASEVKKASADQPSFNTNIIGLIGDLGSGKTAFTKGVGQYFNIKNITSPTFVVMKVYKVKGKSKKVKVKNLVHVDCYRLDDYQSLLDIGLEEYLNDPQSLVLIEWADKIKGSLPKQTKYIKFKLGQKENERIIGFC